MKLNVSLYIPVYNGESTIKSVLKSVIKLDPSPSEIIVVNDASTDGTSSLLKNYTNHIKIINNLSNMGLAYSRNVGIENSKYEDVASLDADVEVSINWLKDLNDLKHKFNSALTGGKLIEKLKDENIYNLWRHFHATQNSYGNNDIDDLKSPLSGSNILLSKSIWKKVGGYETMYRTNGEDSNFCQKLLNNNYKISYSSKSKCYHLRNDTLMSLANASRRGYIYGAGLKKPTFMRFIQRSIRHFKGFLRNSFTDLRNFKPLLVYVSLIVFLNHVVKEFVSLVKNKNDYV